MDDATILTPERGSFEEWMQRVDDCLIRKCGMGHEDLADVCYRDMFDDSLTPFVAARRALRSQF